MENDVILCYVHLPTSGSINITNITANLTHIQQCRHMKKAAGLEKTASFAIL